VQVIGMTLLAAPQSHANNSETYSGAAVTRRLPETVSVSIVLATCNRPEPLRECLDGLLRQESSRTIEIIVVDNRPGTDKAAMIAKEFPQVKFLYESRSGASYARNLGIAASNGEIIVVVDDDTLAPPEWLETLIAPFCDPDVAAVAGNVYGISLATKSERLYETYGSEGVGLGQESWRADSAWFRANKWRSCKTWDVGITANMAFRASLFADPEIGLFDECLGTGSPTGGAEDTLMVYKILRAGKTVFYNPYAFVKHRHRNEMKALRKQLFNYSKGFVAYQLTTLFSYGDYRAIPELLAWLPVWHLWRVVSRLLKLSQHPLSLIVPEIAGSITGPFALWQSHQRVARIGKSIPYVPPDMRSPSEGAETK
jgi:glycosyltransferase involved in cell wall biosynthesis